MKRIVFFLLLCIMSVLAHAQLKVSTRGNVGIGTTMPHYKFDVNIGTVDTFRIRTWTELYIANTGAYGAICIHPMKNYYFQLGKSDYRAGQIWTHELNSLWSIECSDISFKENIRHIENPLLRLKLLNGVQYNLKVDNFNTIPAEAKDSYMRDDYGFIAQEVQEIFPELVIEDEKGMLGVKYTRLIPIMVEAIKEQQQTIENLRQVFYEERSLMMQTIEELQLTIAQQSNLQRTEVSQQKASVANAVQVYQNRPNPFSEMTIVSCFIPSDIQSAQLCIYDMQGTQKKCIRVRDRGHIDVQILGSELSAGIYLYLLEVDGQVSEVKQMILTQ